MALVISAICLFGAMKSCPRRPVVRRPGASNVETVVNQSRPATLPPGEPEPPRVFLDTTYVAPAGKTINVGAGADGKDIGCDIGALNPEWTKN
jgi:hypothetical protein